MIENLMAELDSVDKQISVLTQRRNELQKEIINSSADFAIRFSTWYYGSGGRNLGYAPSIGGKFPNFTKWAKEKRFEFDRHRTYELENLFEEQLSLFLDPECYTLTHSPEAIDLLKKEYQPIFEEFMNNNINSFTYDW